MAFGCTASKTCPGPPTITHGHEGVTSSTVLASGTPEPGRLLPAPQAPADLQAHPRPPGVPPQGPEPLLPGGSVCLGLSTQNVPLTWSPSSAAFVALEAPAHSPELTCTCPQETSEGMNFVRPPGAPGGLRRLSVQLWTSAQVAILRFVSSIPTSGSVLTAQGLLGTLSPSLSTPPPSKINK